jgi:DNA-binding response OmpR family regulator
VKNILIVEDESLVALEISGFVKELGYDVAGVAPSAVKAFDILKKQDVDLILMDVYIKGAMDGVSLAGEIRKSKNIPVIYISAFSDDETLERAILTNPISYLSKPFNRSELKMAIKIALNRKRRKSDSESKLRQGDVRFDDDFSFDTVSEELILDGETIHLTRQEKKLLLLLIEFKNSIVSIYAIENELWPDKAANENTRRALISRLRAKLNYKFLDTVHSEGYKLHI